MSDKDWKFPWDYEPQLTDTVLRYFAEPMLDIYQNVLEDLSTDKDGNYTRGCTTFGRIHKLILDLIQSNERPCPIHLIDGTFKLIFQIGHARIRFCKGDLSDPKTTKIFSDTDPYTPDFFQTDDFPVIWRFILTPPRTDEDEAIVSFVGFNLKGQVLAYWDINYGVSNSKAHLPEPIIPTPVDIAEPIVDDLDEDEVFYEDETSNHSDDNVRNEPIRKLR